MYTKLIVTIEKEIAAAAEMLATLRTLPELEGIVCMHTYTAGRIILRQPYDLEMFGRNRAVLEAQGFVWDGDLSVAAHCGEILTQFKRGSLVIHFQIDPDYSGSTCKKTLIGYDQEPIYEVTCLEA